MSFRVLTSLGINGNAVPKIGKYPSTCSLKFTRCDANERGAHVEGVGGEGRWDVPFAPRALGLFKLSSFPSLCPDHHHLIQQFPGKVHV